MQSFPGYKNALIQLIMYRRMSTVEVISQRMGKRLILLITLVNSQIILQGNLTSLWGTFSAKCQPNHLQTFSEIKEQHYNGCMIAILVHYSLYSIQSTHLIIQIPSHLTGHSISVTLAGFSFTSPSSPLLWLCVLLSYMTFCISRALNSLYYMVTTSKLIVQASGTSVHHTLLLQIPVYITTSFLKSLLEYLVGISDLIYPAHNSIIPSPPDNFLNISNSPTIYLVAQASLLKHPRFVSSPLSPHATDLPFLLSQHSNYNLNVTNLLPCPL